MVTIRQTKRENDTDGSIYREMTTPRDEVRKLPLDALHPYPNQPFKPYNDEKLQELADDIKINGILNPVIVRKLETGGYQIMAGHNRVSAAKLAGLTEAPVIIRNVDDDAAETIMLTTNLNQRQKLLPSEKAWAYKRLLDSIKRKAGRPTKEIVENQAEKNKVQIAPNKNCDEKSFKLSTEKIGEKSNISKDTVKKYIKLTELHPTLLQMVDDEKIGFIPGYNLAFIKPDRQESLVNFLADNPNCKISVSKSELLRELDENDTFSLLMIREALTPTTNLKHTEWKKATKKTVKLIPITATQEQLDEINDYISNYFKKKK